MNSGLFLATLLLPATLLAQTVPNSGPTEPAAPSWQTSERRPLRLGLYRQPDWDQPSLEGVREVWGGLGLAPRPGLLMSLETRLGRDDHALDPSTRAFLRMPVTARDASGLRSVLRVRLGAGSELQLRPRHHTLGLVYSARW